MKSKLLFILFFSMFSLNSLSAIAAYVNKDIEITADSKCAIDQIPCIGSGTGAIACATAGDDNTFKAGTGGPKIGIIRCSSNTVTANEKNMCSFQCMRAKQILKKDIVDELANVSQNAFTKNACNVLRVATGSAGKTFATFAVIATGIGFFTGKVSWGLMIGVAAGIATMFGGPSIVAAISGQSSELACDINENN
jgi:type IV secretory pathway VirB2 component (pilin)